MDEQEREILSTVDTIVNMIEADMETEAERLGIGGQELADLVATELKTRDWS